MKYALNPKSEFFLKSDGLTLVGLGKKNFKLTGQLAQELIQCLSDAKNIDSIYCGLSHYKPEKILACLCTLCRYHIILQIPDGIDETCLKGLVEIGIKPKRACKLLQDTVIYIYTSVEIDPNPLLSQLKQFGIKATTKINEDTKFCLALCSDYLDNELKNIDTLLSSKSIPWMPIGGSLTNVLIGPILQGQDSGCYRCLSDILSYNKQANQKLAISSRFALPNFRTFYNIAIVEMLKHLGGIDSECSGQVLTLNSSSHALDKHIFHKNPDCIQCGEKSIDREFKPIDLRNSLSTHLSDAGLRNVAAQATLDQYSSFISPLTGVIGHVQKLDCKLSSVHVYTSSHNSVVQNESLNHNHKYIRSTCAGKGSSDIQAKVSALCEGIERFSGQRSGAESTQLLSLDQAKSFYKDKAIHPNDVMLFSEDQYLYRSKTNLSASYYNFIPNKLPSDQPIHWSKLWSLTSKQIYHLPTQLLYNGPTAESIDRFAIGCSNGCASGSTIEDAVLQGLLEIIERDCIAIWWYNMIQRPSIDLDSCKDEWIKHLREDMHAIGREIWVLNIASDLPVPCFAAFSREMLGQGEKILFGFGCHLDPLIAVKRALAEMTQNLIPVLQSINQAVLHKYDRITYEWISQATISRYTYLQASTKVPPQNISLIKNVSSNNIVGDINYLIDTLRSINLEVLVLNQTRRMIGMPVVKVVVPGLRHFWPRFGPGRLYDVPIKCGWLQQPVLEEQLNQTPVFF